MRRAGRLLALCLVKPSVLAARVAADPRLDRFKDEIARTIDARAKLAAHLWRGALLEQRLTRFTIKRMMALDNCAKARLSGVR